MVCESGDIPGRRNSRSKSPEKPVVGKGALKVNASQHSAEQGERKGLVCFVVRRATGRDQSQRDFGLELGDGEMVFNKQRFFLFFFLTLDCLLLFYYYCSFFLFSFFQKESSCHISG